MLTERPVLLLRVIDLLSGLSPGALLNRFQITFPQWGATACVASLVEDSVLQLFLLLILQVVLLIIISCFQPFVNRCKTVLIFK